MAGFTTFFILFFISSLGFRSAPSLGARDLQPLARLPTIPVEVINNVTNTPAGDRFEREIGADHVRATFQNATVFTWNLFQETSFTETRGYEKITFVLDKLPDGSIGITVGNQTTINSEWVGNYPPEADLKLDFTGVLYHENTHIWQFLGENANVGVVEGIADFVRLRSGFAPVNWLKPGEGNKWDEGYAVTARFFEYLDDSKPGFVAALNKKMAGTYSDDFFVELLGKPVDQLWKENKDKYKGQN